MIWMVAMYLIALFWYKKGFLQFFMAIVLIGLLTELYHDWWILDLFAMCFVYLVPILLLNLYWMLQIKPLKLLSQVMIGPELFEFAKILLIYMLLLFDRLLRHGFVGSLPVSQYLFEGLFFLSFFLSFYLTKRFYLRLLLSSLLLLFSQLLYTLL